MSITESLLNAYRCVVLMQNAQPEPSRARQDALGELYEWITGALELVSEVEVPHARH
jgi:hypothetical protein